MDNRRGTPRRLLAAIGVAASLAAQYLVLPPAWATGSTCGNGGGWCNGNDGSTRHNISDNEPQIYLGEVGVYYHDFEGMSGPCTGDPYDACFSPGAAAGADTRWSAGTGLGVQFYYFGGGSTASAENDYGSAYCWGYRQGYKATAHVASQYLQYIPEGYIIAFDIEAGSQGADQFGWSNLYPSRNRKILDGFRDYVQGIPSNDTANCNYNNTGTPYQEDVYSSPSEWSYAFTSDITQTPIWTYVYDCYPNWPGGFSPSSDSTHNARWFGGSSWKEMWQFKHVCINQDYDIAKEPMWLPWFQIYIGS